MAEEIFSFVFRLLDSYEVKTTIVRYNQLSEQNRPSDLIVLSFRWNNAGIYCDITLPILAKKKIIFSEEAHFDLGGYINKQNCRNWGTENPHAYI